MPTPDSARLASRATVLAGGILVLAIVVAYANAFGGPFLFDDQSAILRNPTIRQLWPPWSALSPPVSGSAGVVGRPIVNLSLAFNHALGGFDPRGYHVANVLIHAGAALALLGLVRRTLDLRRARPPVPAPPPPPRAEEAAALTSVAIAFCVAFLWALHPLQTESVTFVIQRTESLGGLFLLLTFYAFGRAVSVPSTRPRVQRGWLAASVAACLTGMATKEIVAAAPLLVLLYDRTFVAGTFRTAWRERRTYYFALAATWLLLAYLLATNSRRGGTVGFGLGVSSWDYLLTQIRALTLYLQLSCWPHPLVVDYGTPLVRRLSEVWPQLLLLLGLGTAALLSARRWPVVGFAATWFLFILAPSSSFVPLTTQTIAEHRMYLPLAAIVALVVLGLHRWAGRGGLAAALGLGLVLGFATTRRNEDYTSALRLWSGTVHHAPANHRGHYNLANAFAATGRHAEARRHYETALMLRPGDPAVHYNLAGTLLQLGREAEAIGHYETALRLQPDSPDAHANLAAALLRLGRVPEAVQHYEAAARLGMLPAEEHRRFGRALAEIGRIDQALLRLREALRLAPREGETHVLLGMVLSAAGRGPEALRHFTEAVTLHPDDAGARSALGDALIDAHRPAEALSHYEAALRLQPGHAAVLHTSIGNALARLGRVHDAIRHYEEALRLNPGDQEARSNLAAVRSAAERRGLLKK